jgi:hypothetical protein
MSFDPLRLNAALLQVIYNRKFFCRFTVISCHVVKSKGLYLNDAGAKPYDRATPAFMMNDEQYT